MKRTAKIAGLAISVAVLSGCAIGDTTEARPLAVSTPSSLISPTTTMAGRTTTNTPVSVMATTTSTSTPTTTQEPSPTTATTNSATTTSTTVTTTGKKQVTKPTASPTSSSTTQQSTPTTAATVVPVPGGTYPWTKALVGSLGEPWGYTGELWFADEFISIVKTGPNEAVIAMDSFSQRSIRRLVGIDTVKGYTSGAYTMVDFYCNGEVVYSSNARQYNRDVVNPASVSVLYRATVGRTETGCTPS